MYVEFDCENVYLIVLLFLKLCRYLDKMDLYFFYYKIIYFVGIVYEDG